MHSKKVRIDIYKESIRFFCTTDFVGASKKMSGAPLGEHANNDLYDALFVWNHETNTDYGIILAPGRKPSVICHECCHAALAILHHIHSPVDHHNDEHFAYLQEFLFDQCFKWYYSLEENKDVLRKFV